jgi:hypothetical protein
MPPDTPVQKLLHRILRFQSTGNVRTVRCPSEEQGDRKKRYPRQPSCLISLCYLVIT